MTEVIFISGIHGTGKSTIAKSISSKLGIPYASSSEIIKNINSIENWDVHKRVSNLTSNQDALIHGIELYYSKFSTLILDGHFTLIDKSNEISIIHESVFSKLNISVVILCKLEVQLIYERLIKRDSVAHDIEFLESFQEEEINQAEKNARLLDVPLIYFDTKKDSVEGLISKIMDEGKIFK